MYLGGGEMRKGLARYNRDERFLTPRTLLQMTDLFSARLGDFAGGAVHFVEKGAELDGILLPRTHFDSAGNINGKGANDADGFGDIFRSEPAGENDALRLRGGTGSVPVAGDAASAVLAGKRGIEKKGRSAAITGKIRRASSLADWQCLNHRQTASDSVDHLRRFVAVKLRSSEAQGFAEGDDGSL